MNLIRPAAMLTFTAVATALLGAPPNLTVLVLLAAAGVLVSVECSVKQTR